MTSVYPSDFHWAVLLSGKPLWLPNSQTSPKLNHHHIFHMILSFIDIIHLNYMDVVYLFNVCLPYKTVSAKGLTLFCSTMEPQPLAWGRIMKNTIEINYYIFKSVSWVYHFLHRPLLIISEHRKKQDNLW